MLLELYVSAIVEAIFITNTLHSQICAYPQYLYIVATINKLLQ